MWWFVGAFVVVVVVMVVVVVVAAVVVVVVVMVVVVVVVAAAAAAVVVVVIHFNSPSASSSVCPYTIDVSTSVECQATRLLQLSILLHQVSDLVLGILTPNLRACPSTSCGMRAWRLATPQRHDARQPSKRHTLPGRRGQAEFAVSRRFGVLPPSFSPLPTALARSGAPL